MKIYYVVIDGINTCENIDQNGGDDVDSDGPVQTRPSVCEVLQGAATLN